MQSIKNNENKWAAIIQQKFCLNTNKFTKVWAKAIYLAVEKKIINKIWQVNGISQSIKSKEKKETIPPLCNRGGADVADDAVLMQKYC